MNNPDNRRLNIRQIATLAGVSPSTVSRALNNYPQINPETRARIQAVIAEMDYSPSPIARSLKTRRTYTVGLAVRSFADTWVIKCIPPIESTLRAAGYQVYVTSHDMDPEQEKNMIRSFWDRQVDGIILTSFTLGSWITTQQTDDKPPLVIFNLTGDISYPNSVIVDLEEGARKAAEHLLGLGHTRIGHLLIDPNRESSRLRLSGYRRALDAAGITFQPELIVYTDQDETGGAHGLEKLLQLQKPPTAILCFNDLVAIGALDAARTLGIQVPADLSIMGFDDIGFSRYVTPRLTTIHLPMEDIGRQAVEMLLSLMNGGDIPSPVVLPVRLVVRESTAPPTARQG